MLYFSVCMPLLETFGPDDQFSQNLVWVLMLLEATTASCFLISCS